LASWGHDYGNNYTVWAGVEDPQSSTEKRREIAIVHLRKVLNRARQFATVMDIPARPPLSLRMLLVVGDLKKPIRRFSSIQMAS
jgi:hypothetical protein